MTTRKTTGKPKEPPARASPGVPATGGDAVHYSGVLVRTRPEDTAEGMAAVDALPSVEVHHADPDTGRIVAVLDSDGIEGLEASLRRIRALPGVLLAAPIYHYVDHPGEDRDTDGKHP